MSSWDEFCQSVKRAANRAGELINQSADLATLQVKLSVAEHKLEEAYAELGRLAYRRETLQEAPSQKAWDSARREVDERVAECNDLKKQIETAKSASKKEESANDNASV